MDQKTWLWRKKSSEKTILATLEEVVTNEKEVDLGNSLKTLNEELASVVDECSAKDELLQNHKKTAEDAIADKQKAEEEIRCLKEELEQQKKTSNERLADLNSAFKDCMDQLNGVRNDQDQMVRNAVIKTSAEFERSQKKLEEKLSETSKKLASLTAENSYLSKALFVKEKLMEDLNAIKNQTEAEFEALMARLDSVEKENAFLRYEFISLEKELHHRNEELEYNRRSLEASNKQHLESGKKIKKLEAECQRLRAITRKQLPGLGVLGNMQSHVEVQGRNQGYFRRNVVANGDSVDHTNKQLTFLIDQLQDLQKENRIFKECLAKKEEEILYLTNQEKFALVSGSDDKSTDQKTEAECTMMASEMRLMDDFVEMEKLAIVAVDSSLGASDGSLKELCGANMNSTGKELVPVGQGDDWLQVVRNAILEQHDVSKKSLDELLADVRATLHGTVHSESSKLLPISGYLTWKSPTSSPCSSLILDSGAELMQPDLNTSISRIIELVGRFDSPPSDDDSKSSNKIHVFGWKRSELAMVLQGFVRSCNNVMDGKVDFEKFTGDLASVLGWIVDKSVSYHDHSTVLDEFKKHLGGDGPGTALELESVQNLMLEMEKMHSAFQVEIEGLKDDLSEETEILKESKGKNEDEIENLKLVNEDLDTQLSVTRAKLSELVQKLSSVEVELDNKSHHCEELEGTCLELQLQLESVTSNQHSDNNDNKEGIRQAGLDITKASAKLAECEETILKLGKQLKTLGSAKEVSVVDKAVDTRNNKFKQRSSLLDQMLCEDNARASNPESPKTKEVITRTGANPVVPAAASFPDGQLVPHIPYLGTKNESRNTRAGSLVIVPTKKRGAGGISLLGKFLLRRKRSSSSSKNTSSSSKNTTSFYFAK